MALLGVSINTLDKHRIVVYKYWDYYRGNDQFYKASVFFTALQLVPLN